MLVFRALSSRKCQPADLLRVLSGRTSTSHPALHNIYRRANNHESDNQIKNASRGEKERIKTRLQSGKVLALRAALKEGVGNINVANRALLDNINSQIDMQLGELQEAFGCLRAQKPPNSRDNAEARKMLNEFNRELDLRIKTKSGSLVGCQTADLMGKLDNKALAKLTQETQVNPLDKTENQPVCRQFLQDCASYPLVFEYPDGRKEPLLDERTKTAIKAAGAGVQSSLAHKQVADKMRQFCGDQSMQVSQIACRPFASQLTTENLQLPMPTSSDGDPAHLLSGTKANLGFVIKKLDDGGFKVKICSRQTLQSMVGDVGSGAGNIGSTASALGMTEDDQPGPGIFEEELNMNMSHLNVNADIKVDRNGITSWLGLNYDYSATPIMHGEHLAMPNGYMAGMPDIEDADKWILREQMGTTAKDWFNTALLDRESAQEIGSDLHVFMTTAPESLENSKAVKELTQLKNEKIIDSKLADGIASHLKQINSVISGFVNEHHDSGAEKIEAMIDNFALLSDGIRASQFQLEEISTQMSEKLDRASATRLTTLIAALAVACEESLSTLGAVTADHRANLDDYRGGVARAAASSRMSRAELAGIQSEAMLTALRYLKASDANCSDSQKLANLIRVVAERNTVRQANLQHCRSEAAAEPQDAGPGASGAQYGTAAGQVLRDIERTGELPYAHPLLSEAQLIELLVQQLARESSPALAKALAGLSSAYSEAFVNQLSGGSWAPIKNSFMDVGFNGKLRRVTSEIIPAKHFDEPAFVRSQNNRGVPSCARLQGGHACNLALTRLSNENGQPMFAGLRHGALDAYDITKQNLAKAPTEVIKRLAGETASMRPALSSKNAAHFRAAANKNMARELVRAAVAGNPVLLKRALAGEPTIVRMDSLSLSAPELTRPFSGSEARIIRNQQRALKSLGSPIEIEVDGPDGQVKKISVELEPVRQFNFSVGESGIPAMLRKLLAPFLSWRKADRMNREPLEQMVGPLANGEIGGEAAQVLQFLEQGIDNLDMQRVEELQSTGGLPSAFEDQTKHAYAIRTLAMQIKQISARRSHHVSGSEPYQLASRVAQLSNLLGRTTAFSCKSGKDRSGQLDEAIKQIAADCDAFNIPDPGTKPDQLRAANYAFGTGNLTLQQYNTGLRGHILPGKNWRPGSFAAELYTGDSKQMRI